MKYVLIKFNNKPNIYLNLLQDDDYEIIKISIKCDGIGLTLPKTCSELSERVIAQAPYLLFDNNAYVEISKDETTLPLNVEKLVRDNTRFIEISKNIKPFTLKASCTEISATLSLDSSPDVVAGEEKKVYVTINNSYFLNHDCPHNLNFRWWLADGFSLVSGAKTALLPHRNAHNDGEVSVSFTLKAGECVAAKNKCVLEIESEGRFTSLYIPVIFFG